MSVRRLSPQANLLRTSRLFSLPTPLDRPSTDSTIGTNESDTSTLPYPTHAAIETTEASRARGDWGLKRSLPLRNTTRPGSAHLNFKNMESGDQVIDFQPATGYTNTLAKFQEMALSMSRHNRKDSEAQQSVFDAKYDNLEPGNGGRRGRWKFEGPWFPGQSRSDFEHYVEKNVKTRRTEFRIFLKEALIRNKAAERRRQLIESGLEESEGDAGSDISDVELQRFIKHLRQDPEYLQKYVKEFLDLPRVTDPTETKQGFGASGPPSMHPSAGLSYLRTHAHTYNHPLYGPQEQRAPVQARVLATQGDFSRTRAILGIGGVTSEEHQTSQPISGSFFGSSSNKFDPTIPGGAKTWVQLRKASINSSGRIRIASQRAETDALNSLGLVPDKPTLSEAARRGTETESMPYLGSISPGQSETRGNKSGPVDVIGLTRQSKDSEERLLRTLSTSKRYRSPDER